ncbi:amidohydrolase family protein [Asticcacaulis biprosthecium C19]|uniref:Amidohydrolase family protein n=1 Tax=Asticcacaulis biprosthecium C19 TaxID=715226 RepID=F4QSG1_9CAUL|nr:amidohydrolase family protein [Asticcacaulis biprosthecium]EGF89681.1 amidohydrolase family protein [Asticcacaulis biprosthecium C19]
MIDAHAHFWDPARLSYDWLKYVPDIAHAHLPEHFIHAGSVVFVQSDCAPDQALQEVDWAGQFEIAGIVAYAPLELSVAVTPHLAQLVQRPLVKGIRRNTQNEPDGFMLDGYAAGMIATARTGLTIDMCIRAQQIPELLRALDVLFNAMPAATVILDHLGKPDIAGGEYDGWASDLSRIAEFPGLFCKLSGLPTQADWKSWRPEQLMPYLAHAIEVFSPERCLFGGDWPVVDLAGGYEPWRQTVETAVTGLTEAQQERIWSGTARAVYKL